MFSQIARRASSSLSRPAQPVAVARENFSTIVEVKPAEAPKQNILSKLWSDVTLPTNMPSVPLSLPFTNTASVSRTNPEPVNHSTVTTLSNGIRVVSVETHSPVTAVGVFVDAGSRYENDDTNGAAYLLERMAFKSTKHRGVQTLVRESSQRATHVMASTSRDYMAFSAECLRDHAPYAFRTIREMMLESSLTPWELEQVFENFLQFNGSHHHPDMLSLVHSTAYNGAGLGRSVFPSRDRLSQFGPELLMAYRNTFFVPNRMVISGVGIHHKNLVSLVENFFGDLHRAPELQTEKSHYVGGEARVANEDHNVSYGIAFETANWHSNHVIAATVLQTILGSGDSFSAGGPGKGMYSRLYERVLNQHEWVQAARSFLSVYNDSALLGIFGVAPGSHGRELATTVATQLAKTAERPQEEELQRAKNQLKSAVNMNLESRGIMLEDLARQVAVHGKVRSAAEIVSLIDNVSAQDIQTVARDMLRTTPTVVATGDIRNVPRYDEITKFFK